MQIVIDIDDKTYKAFMVSLAVNLGRSPYKSIIGKFLNAIKNGTVLPKGHGRLIDTNEITAFRELECNGHDIDNLNEFTTIIEADKEITT